MPAPMGMFLANLPWKTIIENAPAAVGHARKLLDGVRRRGAGVPARRPEGASADEHVAHLAEELSRQSEDLAALAQTVGELAELNGALVAEVDQLRRRIRVTYFLAGLATLAGVVSVAALVQ